MAASSTAVTVLTPNGRRQTIKVSPNTVLLQVLEDVCKKHGFNSDDHGLKFQRNVLDLTLQWRYASLPNNAKLEMVATTRKQTPADSQVRIALQMEDGSRLQGSFSCGQNLWDLLTHFPQTSVSELCGSETTPVCVYMRDEVSGEEALKTATLKSLGLTGGSAIIRFLVKKKKGPEEEYDGGDFMESAPTSTKPVAKETPPSPSLDPAPPATSRPQPLEVEVPIKCLRPDSPVETLTDPSPAYNATNTLPVKQEVRPGPQTDVLPKAPPTQLDDGELAGPSGLNFTDHPVSSSSSSSVPPPAFVPFSGGGQRLGGPGGGGAACPSSSLSSLPALGVSVGPPKAKKAKPSSCSTVKHPALSNQEEEDISQKEEFLEPVEREPLVYHLDSTAHPHGKNHQDLPEEFFEVTVDDVRKRFAQLKSERRVLEETPLMTKNLREAQMREKMERYPKVVVRVQFPDRHVLQGFFRPLETVSTLRNFVKSHLDDPQLCFYLFIVPPKTILDDPSATMFQANLFPGALVYFGTDVLRDRYLQSAVVESQVSALQANESIASCIPRSSVPTQPSSVVHEKPSLPPTDVVVANSGPRHDEDVDPPSAHNQEPKPSRTDTGKVPKWLKLPGKK